MKVRTTQISIVLSVILIWEFITELGLVNPIILTPLSKTIVNMAEDFRSGLIFRHLKTTLFEFGIAYAIGMSFGLLTGFSLGMITPLREIYEPVIVSLYAVPIIILYPIILIILGFGTASKIAFAGVMCFFPVCLNTIAGMKSVDKRFIMAATTMGASKGEIVWKVAIPAALPIIITGLRLGMNSAMIGVIAGEMIASLKGMGYKIGEAATTLDIPSLYTFILVTLVCIITLNQGAGLLEKLIGAWRE